MTRSRRVQGLKPTDYDHEIVTVDHDGLETSPDVSRVSTTAGLIQHRGRDGDPSADHAYEHPDDDDDVRFQERPVDELRREEDGPEGHLRPSIEVQSPTPHGLDTADVDHVKPHPRVERETAVDILYENERGGFLCGLALFSSQALGSLDSQPWTNQYHHPSPTNIHTAQVPDPSWEWAWPEWHLNHQDGMDEFGWEYSFAFSGRFSWHGPTWWNSFVRRRAWTRKRIKKRPEDLSADPHMLNADYFNVLPASDRHRLSKASMGSLGNSGAGSRAPSMAQVSEPEKRDIDDIDTLMHTLRLARIDREKLEAVENYLEHATDLPKLQHEMHDIMSIFVFQASRRRLLAHLMQLYDSAAAQRPDDRQALRAAVEHADEEVRRLAYWSDVKQMAEAGESRGAVDGGKGWEDGWQGVDQSGPVQPNGGKLPEP